MRSCILMGVALLAFVGFVAPAFAGPDVYAIPGVALVAGNPRLVALVAVACKLVTILNGVLRNNAPRRSRNA